MRETRKALELGDIAALTKSCKDALWYLCLDLDCRRGRTKKDLVRELLRWRKAQGPFITDPRWEDMDAVEDTVSRPNPLSRTYPSTVHVTPPPSRSQTGGTLAYPATPTPLTSSVFNAIFQPHSDTTAPGQVLVRMELPLEISANKIDAGEDLLSRVKTKKKTRPNTVVLGNVILKTVSDDMQKTMVPRWINPAPIRTGQKKHGKLSADQWRVFCGIHLTVTLIRLWGRQPQDSRWYQMLVNFLDLVKAVEIGSMLVTSKDHIDEYETLMTRYLVTMKSLYKEARVVPNHHLALHTPDFLKYWGPSPETRGFGWERYNHTLQQINTNRRFVTIDPPGSRKYSSTAEKLQALPPPFVEEDWFRQFGSIGGSLWSTEYEQDFSIIWPESIVCHFARTRLEEVDTGFGFPTFHVLPLDRLKTHIERSGIPMKDDAFDDVVGSEDEEDENGTEGD
ncbi:hypothetical protein H1R20_g15653, partial [Candolleomyces eurysporus]